MRPLPSRRSIVVSRQEPAPADLVAFAAEQGSWLSGLFPPGRFGQALNFPAWPSKNRMVLPTQGQAQRFKFF